MTWILRSKKHMGMRKLLACLSLLLLMLIELETPCFAEGYKYNKLSRFKGRSDSEMNSLKPHKAFKGNADNKNDDDVFGAEKRKVYTGPNPLHNR